MKSKPKIVRSVKSNFSSRGTSTRVRNPYGFIFNYFLLVMLFMFFPWLYAVLSLSREINNLTHMNVEEEKKTFWNQVFRLELDPLLKDVMAIKKKKYIKQRNSKRVFYGECYAGRAWNKGWKIWIQYNSVQGRVKISCLSDREDSISIGVKAYSKSWLLLKLRQYQGDRILPLVWGNYSGLPVPTEVPVQGDRQLYFPQWENHVILDSTSSSSGLSSFELILL